MDASITFLDDHRPREPQDTNRIFKLPPLWFNDRRVKCHGLMSFFYPNQPSSEVANAKAMCNGSRRIDADTKKVVIDSPCAFRDKCLGWAIDEHEAYGVWGGTSERDRRKIQRARNRFKNPLIYNLEDVRFPQTHTVQSQRIVLIERRAVT